MRDIKDIKIPDINWSKVEALDEKEAKDKAEKSVEFLINFRTATSGGRILIKRSIEEEAQKVRNGLGEWIKEYKGFIYVVQTAFLEKAREIAAKDGESKILFSRLKVLALEALFHRSVQDWAGRVDAAPHRLRNDFLSEVRMSQRTLFLLPNNWRNDTHKSTALILKDLARKAKIQWMKEKGYIKPKPETPPKDEKPKEKDEKKTKTRTKTKSKPKKKPTRSKPKKTTRKKAAVENSDKKVAAQKKKTVEKISEEEDEADIRSARGKSVKDFAEIGEILPKK